jgi:hypothetical protein
LSPEQLQDLIPVKLAAAEVEAFIFATADPKVSGPLSKLRL